MIIPHTKFQRPTMPRSCLKVPGGGWVGGGGVGGCGGGGDGGESKFSVQL